MPSGGSVSPLEKHAQRIFTLIAEQPDLTLDEMVRVLRKWRIPASRSALSRFFARHNITVKKSLIAAERNRDDVARARRRWMREQGGISPPGAEFRTRGRARRVVPISELVFGTLAQKRSSLEPSLGFAAIAGTPHIENGGPFALVFRGRRAGRNNIEFGQPRVAPSHPAATRGARS